jgi:hypothetical protein
MRKSFLRGAAFLAVLALVGCSRGETGTPEDVTTRLGDSTDVDVAEWLTLSRPELAKLAEEWSRTVQLDLEAARNSPDAVDLLPRLHPPVRVPVFREAAYSASLGFSHPGYVKPGKPDAAVALHLARFGDREAALKLADPKEADLRAKLDSVRYEKQYPVEWSRLVGLVIASSQLKIASGSDEAATRLVLVHKQLRSVLDKKAAAGPLGAALLPAGKRALFLASKAWRDPKENKTALAEDVENALAEWGAVPAPQPPLRPGAAKDAVARVFGKPLPGKTLTVAKADLARALDLLSLPIPGESVKNVTAFLDDKEHLAEIQFTYRAGIDSIYPEPANLAFFLDEHGLAARSESRGGSLYHALYQGGGLTFEATRTNSTPALGGWVKVTAADKPARTAATHDLRTYGPVSLDRGFEANRLALAPKLPPPSVLVSDKAALARLVADLGAPVPANAMLQREKAFDLLTGLRLSWPVEQTPKALDGLLPALWSAFGNAKVAAQEDGAGAYLAFTWRDDKTSVQFRLPCDEKGPMLLIEDTRDASKLPERAAAAARRDESERKARLAAGKPDQRLARSPGDVNTFSLAGLKLGQPKAEAEAALPVGKSYRRKEVPHGLSVVILTTPTKGTPYWARQIVLRYDDSDRLAEVRLRYQTGLSTVRKGESLAERLSEAGGAPQVAPGSWEGLWSDLPRSRAKVTELRWQDDATICTARHDAGSAEVTWTDRAQADAGKPLPPLEIILTGVKGCRLGYGKEEVHKALRGPASVSGGAEVYGQPADSPYEMLLVWYEAGKVTRIVAVHRDRPASGAEKDVPVTLSQVWGQDIDNLGFIRRQEGERGQVAGAYFWHDDRSRVQTFVQNTDQGTRLMTEWRRWPWAESKQMVKRTK